MRVVAGVWIREGRVLAARRPPYKRQGGQWELPGGKVEPGETEPEALVRELREELGVEVEVGEALGGVDHACEHGLIELRAWAVRCAAEPVALEHAALAWVGAAELDGLDWAPADRRLLANWRHRLG